MPSPRGMAAVLLLPQVPEGTWGTPLLLEGLAEGTSRQRLSETSRLPRHADVSWEMCRH